MGFTDVLKKAYPFLTIAAQAIPGGNIVASALGQILKLKQGDTLETAGMAVLNAPPEIRVQLQAEEDRHAEVMQQMGIASAEDFEKIATSDRADARNREIQVRDWTPRILAFVVVALCFAGEGLYFRFGAPSSASPELVGRILGTLDSALILVLSYYFGSSAGSDRKTELLAEAPSTKG